LKHRLIETLRKATKALGGNLVVVTSFGRTQLVAAGTSHVLDTTEMTRAEGFALRVKRRTPEESRAPVRLGLRSGSTESVKMVT
jgi:hypothetical protein